MDDPDLVQAKLHERIVFAKPGNCFRQDVVDRIYEASVIPDLWIDILDRLAAIAQCDGGILIAADSQQAVRAVSSDCLSQMLKSFIDEGWMSQNIRAARLGPQNYSGFVVDLDIVTPEEAETDPLYVNCLRKHGGGVGTGTVIPAPSGDLIIFNIERSYKKGFVDRAVLPALDALRPHLQANPTVVSEAGEIAPPFSACSRSVVHK